MTGIAEPIHVTIPGDRRIAGISGVVVHASLAAERARHPVRLPPRTRIEETVLDLADTSNDPNDAADWIGRAIGRRLTTQELLNRAASHRSRLRWRAEIADLLDPDHAGVHSALEYRYLRFVEKPHGLPVSRRQVRVQRNGARQYRDVLYEEYALIVELDGRLAHPGEARWLDIWRDNASAASGSLTLRYGYRDVAVTPCLVAAQVDMVLRLRGWPGQSRRCSASCLVGRLG